MLVDRKSKISDFTRMFRVSLLKMRIRCRAKGASSGSVNTLVFVSSMPIIACSGRIAAYCPDCTAAYICVIEEQLRAGWELKACKNLIVAFAYSPSPVNVQNGILAIGGN